MGYFEMTSPEAVGISSEGIRAFLKETERTGLELHRLMILRHGKCCAKVTWAPYDENDMHPLYSFSKSVTATAIGFARQEGLLSLDEKITDIFPEDVPENPSENLKACTIHHLLCMSCGHETEIGDRSSQWRKSFFAHPFLHEPGTFYQYNTPGSNLLAAIVRKKTGQQVTEYLRPRLFDPLGMGEVYCFQLPDDLETEAGGGGMKMKLEDMAKFTQFMLQDGWWEGKQLLKDWYYDNARVKHMETKGDSAGHVKDWANGYGYQCWMGNLPGSFRADGAFGQFGLVYPTLDLCIITNSATEQTQTMIDAVNEYLLPCVDPEVHGAAEEKGEALCLKKSIPVLTGCRNPMLEEKLNHSVYTLADQDKTLSGIKRLVGGAGIYVIPDDGAVTQIRFSFERDQVVLHFTENGVEKDIAAALDGSFAFSVVDEIRYAATARWRSLRKLEVEIRRMDAMSGARIIFRFDGDRLIPEADETLMTDGGLGMTERRMAEFCQTACLEDVAIEVTGNNPGVVKE